jgi:hypothetical protein
MHSLSLDLKPRSLTSTLVMPTCVITTETYLALINKPLSIREERLTTPPT